MNAYSQLKNTADGSCHGDCYGRENFCMAKNGRKEKGSYGTFLVQFEKLFTPTSLFNLYDFLSC